MNRKIIRHIVRQTIIWTLAFSFWTIMRKFGHDVNELYSMNLWQNVRLHLIMGVFAGLLFGFLEYFFERRIIRRVSFKNALIIGSVMYLGTIVVIMTFGIRTFTRIMGIDLSAKIYTNYIFSNEMLLFIFYAFLVGFMIDFIREVDKKLGPGNLWRMLKGEFYSPKEDERIFMFLDLKSSTAIAEKLGHIKYSRLIQDCFQDLDVVDKYRAEIYQYVGDEAVLTWDKEVGLTNSNCLRAFFDFKERLKARSDYYLKHYDLVPEFKAGLNVGKIVVAEVGKIKSEIAYHGDTINTAARIQGECNRLHVDVLISEDLCQQLYQEPTLKSELKDQIQLRGKQKAINVYSIERIALN